MNHRQKNLSFFVSTLTMYSSSIYRELIYLQLSDVFICINIEEKTWYIRSSFDRIDQKCVYVFFFLLDIDAARFIFKADIKTYFHF